MVGQQPLGIGLEQKWLVILPYVLIGANPFQQFSYSTWDWQDAPFPDGDYFTGKQHGQYYWNGSATGWTYEVEVGPYFYNTKIYWDVNQVTGNGNGSVTGYANTWASGPDTSLLGGWWQIVHG